jgi:cathepsin B
MKYVLLALLIVSVFCYNQQELVDRINNSDLPWKAKVYERWDGWTLEDFRNFLTLRKGPNLPMEEYNGPLIQADIIFDWRTKNPNCLTPIRNQGDCGSCWTFGLTESFADQGCIRGAWSGFTELAPQDLVSCDTTDYGCDGGYLSNSWAYAESKGVVTEKCFPYVSGDGSVPPCPNSCKDGEDWSKSKHYVTGYHHVADSVSTIESTLQTYGPLEVAFSVYQDFMSYTSGVYIYNGIAPYLGGHAVAFVGWGKTTKHPFWIVQNSWGTDWGINGYFWILKGANECGIESEVYYGDPKTYP